MIRIGYHANPNTIALCKSTENGSHTAGFILSGFGTCPAPGEICDNGIERALQFAAHYLQKAIDALFSAKASVEQAQSYLLHQLERINANISYFNRNIGQGIYLAGVLCYFDGDRYICVPFGGGRAYLWENGAISTIGNHKPDDPYIRDALGGMMTHQNMFFIAVGTLPIGAHIICATVDIPHDQIAPVMANLSAVEPQFVVSELSGNSTDYDIPLALIDFAMHPDQRKEEDAE